MSGGADKGERLGEVVIFQSKKQFQRALFNSSAFHQGKVLCKKAPGEAAAPAVTQQERSCT